MIDGLMVSKPGSNIAQLMAPAERDSFSGEAANRDVARVNGSGESVATAITTPQETVAAGKMTAAAATTITLENH